MPEKFVSFSLETSAPPKAQGRWRMKKLIVPLLAATFAFIALILLDKSCRAAPTLEKDNPASSAFSSESVTVTQGDVISGFFSEPFETIVFIFRDGSFLTFSTNDDNAVGVPISWVTGMIEKTGRSISDIILCVHNHFQPSGFTPADVGSYRYLRGKGFRGVFGIFYTTNGQFREIEERQE